MWPNHKANEKLKPLECSMTCYFNSRIHDLLENKTTSSPVNSATSPLKTPPYTHAYRDAVICHVSLTATAGFKCNFSNQNQKDKSWYFDWPLKCQLWVWRRPPKKEKIDSNCWPNPSSLTAADWGARCLCEDMFKLLFQVSWKLFVRCFNDRFTQLLLQITCCLFTELSFKQQLIKRACPPKSMTTISSSPFPEVSWVKYSMLLCIK